MIASCAMICAGAVVRYVSSDAVAAALLACVSNGASRTDMRETTEAADSDINDVLFRPEKEREGNHKGSLSGRHGEKRRGQRSATAGNGTAAGNSEGQRQSRCKQSRSGQAGQ